MNNLIRHVLFLWVSVATLTSCDVFRPEYGPFKLTVVTEDGKKAEDVVVWLSSMVRSIHAGGTFVYDEKMLGNSGEPIIFPRGKIKKQKGDEYIISVNIYHHEYVYNRYTESGKKYGRWSANLTKGEIDLGEFVINRKDYLKVLNKGKNHESGVKTNQTIATEIEDFDTLYLNRVPSFYYRSLVELGRVDLVRKYVDDFIQGYFSKVDTPKYTEEELQRRYELMIREFKEYND